ncbi:MAG: alpha/beta hydrolase [Acidimicrobiales bacterium]
MWHHAEGPQNRLHHLAALVHAPATWPHLGGVAAPTLVVHGAADPVVDPSGGHRIAEGIAGAELLVVDDLGHDLPPAGVLAHNAGPAQVPPDAPGEARRRSLTALLARTRRSRRPRGDDGCGPKR